MIPTRDRWALLERTLGSAVAQRDAAHEIVVVDDGSITPAPPTLLDGAGGISVRMVRHDVSRGVATARNRGAEEARGKWLAFLDDDDLWAPNKLATQLDALRRVRADFAYAGALLVTAKLEVISLVSAPDADQLRRCLSVRSAIPAGASNVVVSTALFRRLGGFDPNLAQLADWDLWLRLAEAGHAAVVPAPLVAYVQHPSNMLATDRRNILLEFRDMKRKHAGLEAHLGRPLHGGGLAMWASERHWRAGHRGRALRTAVTGAAMWRDPRALLWLLALPPRDLARALRLKRSGRTPASAPAWLEALR